MDFSYSFCDTFDLQILGFGIFQYLAEHAENNNVLKPGALKILQNQSCFMQVQQWK